MNVVTALLWIVLGLLVACFLEICLEWLAIHIHRKRNRRLDIELWRDEHEQD